MTAVSVHLGALVVLTARAWMRRQWDERSDAEIVEAVLTGQTEAYAALVRRYQRRLYGVARRMVRSHDDADDVAQEAFVRAYQSLHTFDVSRQFYTWLCRIAMNLAINLADRRRRRATDSLDEHRESAGHEPVAAEDSSERAEHAELARAVERSLAGLPDGMREVFILRAFDDLSYDEIAEVLGIPCGTVMSRLARARERLRERLSPYVEHHARHEAKE